MPSPSKNLTLNAGHSWEYPLSNNERTKWVGKTYEEEIKLIEEEKSMDAIAINTLKQINDRLESEKVQLLNEVYRRNESTNGPLNGNRRKEPRRFRLSLGGELSPKKNIFYEKDDVVYDVEKIVSLQNEKAARKIQRAAERGVNQEGQTGIMDNGSMSSRSYSSRDGATSNPRDRTSNVSNLIPPSDRDEDNKSDTEVEENDELEAAYDFEQFTKQLPQSPRTLEATSSQDLIDFSEKFSSRNEQHGGSSGSKSLPRESAKSDSGESKNSPRYSLSTNSSNPTDAHSNQPDDVVALPKRYLFYGACVIALCVLLGISVVGGIFATRAGYLSLNDLKSILEPGNSNSQTVSSSARSYIVKQQPDTNSEDVDDVLRELAKGSNAGSNAGSNPGNLNLGTQSSSGFSNSGPTNDDIPTSNFQNEKNFPSPVWKIGPQNTDEIIKDKIREGKAAFGSQRCSEATDIFFNLISSNLTNMEIHMPGLLRNYGYSLFCSDPPRNQEALDAFEKAGTYGEVLGMGTGQPRWVYNLEGYIYASYGDYPNSVTAFDNALVEDSKRGSKDEASNLILNNWIGSLILLSKERSENEKKDLMRLAGEGVQELSQSTQTELYDSNINNFIKLIETGEDYSPMLGVFYDWD